MVGGGDVLDAVSGVDDAMGKEGFLVSLYR